MSINSNNQLWERVISLIDMDCFYVQVEQNECKSYLGKPCGVAQYNPYKGGGFVEIQLTSTETHF